jgi:hypothetical protein
MLDHTLMRAALQRGAVACHLHPLLLPTQLWQRDAGPEPPWLLLLLLLLLQQQLLVVVVVACPPLW